MGGSLSGTIDLMLLAILRAGPGHGYAIIAELRERSGGEFDVAEGTVYPVLHQLERDGLLESATTSAQGRRRRVYRITAEGVKASESRVSAWRIYTAAVESVIAGRRRVGLSMEALA